MNIPVDFPDKLIDRLKLLHSKEEYKGILHALGTKRRTTLRVNTLLIAKSDFLALCKEEGIILESVPWYEYGYVLLEPSLHELTTRDVYTKGYCYVQSQSSMIPALLLDPQPGEKVLDIAAAPGSKTTQMAMMMQNKGIIVANDSSQIRLYKLQANLTTQGVSNVTVRRGVGQTVWQEYPEYFDKVLVDVPCSMEGRIDFSDVRSYSFWSTKKIKELVGIQRFLLKSALSACKVGGTIVYSTCTLSPEENEGVVDWLLRKESGSVELESLTLPGIPRFSPMKTWNDRKYVTDIEKTMRILPSADFEGFYIAKFKKTNHTIPASMQSTLAVSSGATV